VKCLIADDDAVSRIILSTLLRDHGHHVVVTENGRQAWDSLAREHFSLVISDWMMPEVDGLELCRRIRAANRPPYTYVILVTALSGRKSYLEGMSAGADDFLTKPVDADELVARVRVAARILGLEEEVTQLRGLLPVCMYCKRIREDGGQWTQIERYIASRTDASFSHGICPECFQTRARQEVEDWKRQRG
jgi:DNA-binding response OmpR family regulator